MIAQFLTTFINVITPVLLGRPPELEGAYVLIALFESNAPLGIIRVGRPRFSQDRLRVEILVRIN